jgi:uncharacterized membrane protein YphA (DoxX/SURF4 family)
LDLHGKKAVASYGNLVSSLDSTDSKPLSHLFIRISLGIVYFHFGFLKFYPDLSPAEVLAMYTSRNMVSYHLDPRTLLFLIAVMECLIGLGFLFGWFMRINAVLFTFHMISTFMPMFVLPEYAFKLAPFAPTMEGQYIIIKNLVLLSAGWAVFAPYFHGFQLSPRRFFKSTSSSTHTQTT